MKILDKFSNIGVGTRTYHYIRNFLSDRTATLSLGHIQSDNINLGSRGTPQGSVLSPYLFNVALLDLPKKLEEIEDLKFSFYADDITLWTNKGSDGEIQERLQRAVDTIQAFISPKGLACSTEKSALLIYTLDSESDGQNPMINPRFSFIMRGKAYPK